MKIAIITPGYPNEHNAAQNVFVQKLVHEFAALGNECLVICPQNRLHREMPLINRERVDRTDNGAEVRVVFPSFYAPWRTAKFPGDPGAESGRISFQQAVKKSIQIHMPDVDVAYGHFLDPAGLCAAEMKREFGCKAYAAFGESSFWALGRFGVGRKIKRLRTLDGIVSVSSENKRRLLEKQVIATDKIHVVPNAIDLSRFYPRDRAEARRRFGFSPDSFIAAFVGGFSERKGVMRVAQALDGQQGIEVAFAGKGELTPNIANQVLCRPLQPDEVPWLLSASDVFVLPTLNEGCCNAVVEAMGCGTAIVSSNRPFNMDILTADNSILIDPTSVEEIRSAVLRLRDDRAYRDRLAAQARRDAARLDLTERARRILAIFNQGQ
ncbi:MAG: glycosyltransferase family 4 protein [Aristaeellaceae bacterium]